MNIGVLSDTHGLMRPEAIEALRGSEVILHAGDIGAPAVLQALSELAPVIAIRGNVDTGDWVQTIPATRRVELAGASIYLLHDLNQLAFDPRERGLQVVISGHSHHPRLKHTDGVLYLNPGSAGPRRFSLSVTVATVEIRAGQIEAKIIELPVTRSKTCG